MALATGSKLSLWVCWESIQDLQKRSKLVFLRLSAPRLCWTGAAAVEEAVDVVRKSQVEVTVPVPVVVAFARTAKNET